MANRSVCAAARIPGIEPDIREENRMIPSRFILALAGAALLAMPVFAAGGHGHSHGHGGETAYGKPGNPKRAARIVAVTMGEADGKMFFSPALIEVKRGEQIRLKLVNAGELDHELVVATLAENLKHAEEMKNTPTWSMTNRTPSASPRRRGEKSCGISPRRGHSISPASFPATAKPA
jgi:uncharacterized cupredoxin-like copper-binding protein